MHFAWRTFAQGLWTRGKDSRILSRVDWKLIGARPREHDEYRIVRKSRNDVPPCLKDELCANNVSNIPSFVGSRSIESSISMLSPLPTRNTILLEGFTRTAPMFHHSIIFYTSSEIFAGSRLNEHDFGSFCAPIISRFERRFRTLTLKKKWEWWDLIGAEKGFVISSNFTPFCCNLHTKVKLSKGRENWLKVNEEWETLEILYQISFRG